MANCGHSVCTSHSAVGVLAQTDSATANPTPFWRTTPTMRCAEPDFLELDSAGRVAAAGGGAATCGVKPRRLGSAWTGRVSVDSTVASLDKLDSSASVLPVRIAVFRHRGSLEVIERHEERHDGAVVGDEVLQQEQIHVPTEVLNNAKKSLYLASVSPSGLLWPS
jgi:hypothetical protein